MPLRIMKMNELLKRAFFGLIFLIVFWAAFSLGFFSWVIFVLTLLVIGLFEFYKICPFSFPLNIFLALVYPVIPFLCLISLYSEGKLLYVYFVSIFSFDTMSYIFGKSFGKKKICPISPNKTWEGFLGGWLAVAFCMEFYFRSTTALIVYSFVFSMLALTGDLYESWLKRKSKLKDSGFILPGHGGVLDRFDAITFTAPLVYLMENFLTGKLS